MIPLDMTTQLAPILWVMDGMILVGVVWLCATYVVGALRDRHAARSRVTPIIDASRQNGAAKRPSGQIAA